MIARLASSRFENARARSTPPASGETTTVVAAEAERAQLLDQDRHRVQVIERDVEEALDLTGVQVDRERAIGAGRRDQVRDELRA